MKMNSITRKLLALCMTVLMLASMAVPAFASEPEGVQPPEGEGQNTEHTHSHQAAVTTAATCTAEGVMTYTCACGDTYTAAIPMAEHIYGEATTVAPGCEAEGSVSASCTVCDFVNTEVIPATGHSYGEATTVAPGCEAEGSVSASCTVCGFVNTEVIPATGHSYGEPVVTAASCTADGSRVCTCSVCGNVYTEVIPAAHTYGEPVVTPSTCTTDGSRVYTCTVEGCGYVHTELIPAAHTYGEPVVADAACTVEGSRTYTCTVEGCGYVHTELIPATGHSYVDMVCSACGATECSWQPDCLAAEHYAECIKGNVDKATVLFDALLNELALTETISDEVRSSVNNQMYVICELEYNHRYAWSSREEYAVYQTAVWDVITGKINQLVNELPAADTVNAENFDAVKARMDKIKLIEEAYRQVWYMTEREPELYQLLNSNANYVELADIISRSVMVMATNPVAVLNGTEYDSVQEAINAAVVGNNTIQLLEGKSIDENILIVQQEGINITLVGANGTTLTGIVEVFGNGRHGGAESVTFQNIAFIARAGAEEVIVSPDRSVHNAYSYAHNISVYGCSFSGSGKTAAALRTEDGGDNRWIISGCTVDSGMHSLLQAQNIETSLLIENCNVSSKNGINLNSSGNVIIRNNTISVAGYAVRTGVGSGGNAGTESITLSNNTLLSASEPPIVLRASSGNANINMSSNSVSAPSGVAHISGESLTDTPTISADANFWGGGEPVVSGTTVEVQSYYTDAEKTDLAYPNAVAKVGDTPYTSLADAIANAEPGATIELLDHVTVDNVVLIDKNLTINGNGNSITSSASRIVRVTSSGVSLTMNGVKMVSSAVRVGTDDIRGISIDANISNVQLSLTNCSVDFTDPSASDWAYGVNVCGNSSGHTVSISGGSYEGANVINVWGSDHTVNVSGAVLTCLYGSNESYWGSCIKDDEDGNTNTFNVSGCTFSGNNAAAFDINKTSALTESSNTDNTYSKHIIAKLRGIGYSSLTDAIADAADGATIELLDNVTITEPIVISKNLSINGNGKTLTYTGSDRAITVESTSPDVNLSISNLTVNAPSAQRGINYNTTGKLTLNKVEVTAGTYAVNLPSSSNGAVVDIDDSKLSANIALNIWGSNANITVDNSALSCLDKTDAESYSAIQLNNDGTNIANGTTVTVTGGSISAEDDSSVVSNWTTTGVVNISSTTTVNGNPPAITVANIGGYGFNTLQDAVKWHAEHNSTANIVLLRDVSLTENLVITRDVTIVPHSSNGYGLSSGGGKISVADNVTLTIDGDYSDEQIAAFRQLCAEGMCVYEGSIKVTKGHTGGTAACDAQAVCDRCQLPYGSTPDHTMKTAATCSTKAICGVCNKPYGELDPDNHALVYTGDGTTNTITETCSNGCGHSATAKLELDSSVSTVYTGSEIKPLKVTYSEKWMAEKNLAVSYKDNIAIGKDASGTIEKANADSSKATATAKFEITRATYSLVVNNYRYVRGSGYPLSFTTNVPYSAGNTVTKLLIYRANGTPVMEVPAAHFVLSANNSGMTVITLSPTVMNALDALHYELYASFTNGDAKGAFRVLLPFIFPMTGDDAQTVVLLCVMFIALGTAGVTLFIMRRKNKANRYNGRH